MVASSGSLRGFLSRPMVGATRRTNLRVIARPCRDVARRLPLVAYDRKGAAVAASARLE